MYLIFNPHRLAVLTVLATVGFAAAPAGAATLPVNALGVGGWTSGDTRAITGSPATPAQIGSQIIFMGEGQVVNDAAGGVPDASPTGSLNGLGYVRLDGTSANAGKSSIGYYGDIAAASALVDGSFGLSFRYYVDSNPTKRTLGLTITISNGTNEYNLSYVNPANAYDSWNTASVTDITGAFKLYTGPGALGGSSPAETLADWSTDPTFGSLFNTDYEITGIGFNLGSYQRNALAYLDSTQTNLLNGGDVIDFQAVPEPASMALLGAGLLSLAMVRRRRKQG